MDGDRDAEDVGQRADLPPGVEVFRIAGPLFFGVASELLDTLRRVGQRPRIIILRMRLVPLLDASGLAALESFVEQAHHAGTRVIMSGVQAQPMAMLHRAGLGAASTVVQHAADFAQTRALASALLEPQP
jgi:SulP family sulfate permease